MIIIILLQVVIIVMLWASIKAQTELINHLNPPRRQKPHRPGADAQQGYANIKYADGTTHKVKL